MAGQNTGKQPRRRAGIAHVQHISRFAQLPDSRPGYDPERTLLLHLRTQRTHGGGGAQHVLAFEQMVNRGLSAREGGEHERTMADGLVTRHTDDTTQRGSGTRHGKRTGGGSRCMCHTLFIPALTPASQSATGWLHHKNHPQQTPPQHGRHGKMHTTPTFGFDMSENTMACGLALASGRFSPAARPGGSPTDLTVFSGGVRPLPCLIRHPSDQDRQVAR